MNNLSYLPKDCWLPDNSVNDCYQCEKAFSTLRRKHHCRYCGYIFCSKCTSNKHQLVDGTLLKRICEKCLESIVKTYAAPTTQVEFYPAIPRKNSEKQLNSILEPGEEHQVPEEQLILNNLEENPEQGAFKVFEEVKSEQFSQYNEDAENFLLTRIKIILSEKKVSESWTEILTNATKTVVTSICPSVHYRKDSMDINQYLRVIRIVDSEKSLKYVKGVVFEKNLANKKMIKKVVHPKLLLLKGNAGFFSEEKKLISISQLDIQERHYSTMLIKKFNNIKPDLVIVEKGMPQALISELSQYNISILINVKLKILDLIARVSNGEILEHIDHTSWKTNYLGYCSEFIQESINDKVLAIFTHPDHGHLCGSIILYGPDKAELKAVSEILRELVLEYRNILIERYIFAQSGMQNIPNIFLEMHSVESNFKHLSIINNKPCSKPGVHNVKYYTAKGKALGDYIMNMMTSPQARCETGKVHKQGVHTYYYCKNSGRVKISMHKTNASFDELMISKECTKCQNTIIDPVPLSKSAWEYSFNKFINNFFTILPVSHVTSTCFHDFFKSGSFAFSYKNLQVTIEWEDFRMLEIVQMKHEMNIEKFNELTVQTTTTLKNNAEQVIATLFEMINELMLQVNIIGTSEEALNIVESLQGVGQSIEAVKCFLPQLRVENFCNYLEVENYRRNLFLKFCSVKVNIVNINKKIRKLVAGEGQAETEEKEEKIYNNDYEGVMYSLDDDISEDDELLKLPSFTALKNGIVNLPIGRENLCIPLDESDYFSILSYTLNSQEYYDKVVSAISGPDDLIEIHESNTTLNFTHYFSNYDEDEIFEHPYREGITNLYGEHISVHTTVYYSKQFHIIRGVKSGSEREIILSLSKGASSNSLQLGKSKAYFKFSNDKKFLIKILDEKRFQMFLDMANTYFRHIYMSSYHGMPSCLVRILGAYKIQLKNHSTGKSKTDWFILSENLGYGLGPNIKIYDLKGTDNQRRKVKEGDSRTKMDLNFLEDFKGIPLPVTPEDKRILDASIWNDTLFLSKQNIIDYSLLVMIDLDDGKLAAGIIDYMEQYTLEKAIESKYKKVVGTELPTITHPNVYKQRFRTQVTQLYFMSLEA